MHWFLTGMIIENRRREKEREREMEGEGEGEGKLEGVGERE